jgi:hypothetical protein
VAVAAQLPEAEAATALLLLSRLMARMVDPAGATGQVSGDE